jgi:hypothetical protein
MSNKVLTVSDEEFMKSINTGVSDILRKYGYETDTSYAYEYYIPPGQTKSNVTVTEQLLMELLNNQSKQNSVMIKLLASMERETSSVRSYYYDVSNSISTAYTTDPGDPGSSNYTRLRVNELIGRNAPKINLYNDGPGTLYVRVAHNVEIFSSSEFPLYEGEAKAYLNVHELRLRASRANCSYRATEYELWKQKNVDFRAGRGYVRTQTIAVPGVGTVQNIYDNADVHNFNTLLTRNASTGYIKNTNALNDLYVWFSQDGTEYGQSGAGVTVEYTTVDPNGAVNIDYMDVHSIKVGALVALTYQIVTA